jgi:hypothetical protein
MGRLVYKTIECPNCAATIEDVEIEVISGAERDTNVGAEWTQPKDTRCEACGDTITDDDLQILCGDEIQELIEESADDDDPTEQE